MNDSAALTALALVCTLSPSSAESSSELIARQLLDELATHDVAGASVRVVDHDVKPGVQLDMGDGDAWPRIRAQMIDADILIISTPTWMGQQSSVCQRVLERPRRDSGRHRFHHGDGGGQRRPPRPAAAR